MKRYEKDAAAVFAINPEDSLGLKAKRQSFENDLLREQQMQDEHHRKMLLKL